MRLTLPFVKHAVTAASKIQKRKQFTTSFNLVQFRNML